MSKIVPIITFLVGTVAGGVASYMYFEKRIDQKYKDIYEKELEDELRYRVNKAAKALEADIDKLKTTKENLEEARKLVTNTIWGAPGNVDEEIDETVKEVDYRIIAKQYSTPNATIEPSSRISEEDEDVDIPPEEPKESNPNAKEYPYIIHADEFGEFESYNRFTLTYFADYQLADEQDDRIDDPVGLLGKEIVGYLKACVRNDRVREMVYVRNDEKRCDYEVTFDLRPYSEVLELMPMSRRAENDSRKRN